MTTQAPDMTAHELDELLHAHFIKPDDRIELAGAGAVYLTEVTAPDSNRRADAVHIGLWSSRGAGRIDVCELKVSRADFRRELDKPEKAEAWWPYCNAFWIVAPSTDVAPPEELPHGWGLMVPGGRGRRFKVVVKPKEREATLTVPMLLTLLKNTETTRTNALRQQREQLFKKYQQQLQAARQERASYSRGDRDRLTLLAELEEAVGLKLSEYPWGTGRVTPKTMADGLRAYMQGPAALEKARDVAESAIEQLERTAQEARRQADELRKAMKG